MRPELKTEDLSHKAEQELGEPEVEPESWRESATRVEPRRRAAPKQWDGQDFGFIQEVTRDRLRARKFRHGPLGGDWPYSLQVNEPVLPLWL